MRAMTLLLYGIAILFLVFVFTVAYMTWMPSPKPEIREEPSALIYLEFRLKSHVSELSKYPQGRNDFVNDNLTPARDYIAAQFSKAGLKPEFQTYQCKGNEYSNVIAKLPSSGNKDDVLVLGAHYDSVESSPGANDNASGVAALIEIGRYLSTRALNRDIQLVAFANEEVPHFQTQEWVVWFLPKV